MAAVMSCGSASTVFYFFALTSSRWIPLGKPLERTQNWTKLGGKVTCSGSTDSELSTIAIGSGLLLTLYRNADRGIPTGDR
ncbi:hypothetical protein HLI03_10315 [Rhizobium laguerreae]|uniref:hypothetical protein n=1 Tax=Rhizobium laguerreae TaxID=1076926 RepID=UPI00147884B1|nr:hypothetical protein [Rhizobium laguerreae]NNH42056.1 hypothetical protein [Rhizobium laguerreae]NNH57266.1 hypothetical protein [Rhizobium laguerreae]